MNVWALRLCVGTLGCGPFLVAACGVEDVEMFSRSNAELVLHVGETCDLGVVGDGETLIDEHAPECAPGYCIGQQGQPWTSDESGLCTCRCDGPAGTGLLCDCADGFDCKRLIEDVGLESAHLVGSYCVPNE